MPRTLAAAAIGALLLAGPALAGEASPLQTFLDYGATEVSLYYDVFNAYDVPAASAEAEVTYFVAKDDAYASYNGSDVESVMAALANDSAAFYGLATAFSAVNGTYPTRYLTDGPLETFSGHLITVTQERPSLPFVVRSPTGENATIIESNVWAGNSIVHFLDGPIFPPFPPYLNATD